VKNFSGPVSTVDCFEDNSFVKKKLSEKNEGGILVVCGKKSSKVALLGDMIATMAIENGWSGIVINGYVRDIEILRELEIGVMALGTCPRKSKKENKGKIDTILTINSVIVQPGNWLYADANGILIAKTRLDL
jgi:regulator of ribonuclease activity A